MGVVLLPVASHSWNTMQAQTFNMRTLNTDCYIFSENALQWPNLQFAPYKQNLKWKTHRKHSNSTREKHGPSEDRPRLPCFSGVEARGKYHAGIFFLCNETMAEEKKQQPQQVKPKVCFCIFWYVFEFFDFVNNVNSF